MEVVKSVELLLFQYCFNSIRVHPNDVCLSNRVGLISFGLYPNCRDARFVRPVDNQCFIVGRTSRASLQREESPMRLYLDLSKQNDIFTHFLRGAPEVCRSFPTPGAEARRDSEPGG